MAQQKLAIGDSPTQALQYFQETCRCERFSQHLREQHRVARGEGEWYNRLCIGIPDWQGNVAKDHSDDS